MSRAERAKMIARLKVERGTLTEYPIAEEVKGGWQNGVNFYPDETVTAILERYVHEDEASDAWDSGHQHATQEWKRQIQELSLRINNALKWAYSHDNPDAVPGSFEDRMLSEAAHVAGILKGPIVPLLPAHVTVHDQHEESSKALASGVAAVERIVRERDVWKRMCAEETKAWADQVIRADEAERLAQVRLDRLMQLLDEEKPTTIMTGVATADGFEPTSDWQPLDGRHQT